MKNQPKIITLFGRQEGLDSQMQIDGKAVMVYDSRNEISLFSRLGGLTLVNESNPIELDKKCLLENYVVSAHFGKRVFTYDTMADTDTDQEFIGVRVPKSKIEKVISEITAKKGDNIIFGREVSPKKLRQYIEEIKNNYSLEQIKRFYNLSKAKQKEILRDLLLREWDGTMKGEEGK
jgi:hypothetical protein